MPKLGRAMLGAVVASILACESASASTYILDCLGSMSSGIGVRDTFLIEEAFLPWSKPRITLAGFGTPAAISRGPIVTKYSGSQIEFYWVERETTHSREVAPNSVDLYRLSVEIDRMTGTGTLWTTRLHERALGEDTHRFIKCTVVDKAIP